MKNLILFSALILIFSACDTYKAFPEPELPVQYVVFSDAWYNSSGHTIFLEYEIPLSDGGAIHQYYNKIGEFDFASYLKENNHIVIVSMNASEYGITLKLEKDAECPAKLIFNTNEPFYYCRHADSSWRLGCAIQAKAYIKTPELDVFDITVSP